MNIVTLIMLSLLLIGSDAVCSLLVLFNKFPLRKSNIFTFSNIIPFTKMHLEYTVVAGFGRDCKCEGR